jgi:hypothetical protein
MGMTAKKQRDFEPFCPRDLVGGVRNAQSKFQIAAWIGGKTGAQIPVKPWTLIA